MDRKASGPGWTTKSSGTNLGFANCTLGRECGATADGALPLGLRYSFAPKVAKNLTPIKGEENFITSVTGRNYPLSHDRSTAAPASPHC